MKNIFALAMIFATVAFSAQSMAIPVADHMTCAKAVSYYEKYKRIYVYGNGGEGDIIPIYGMKPASQWRSLHCTGRRSMVKSYWVNTTDTDTCVVAVYCG
jgi:hypothetical protein